eukprot:COSAG01_NODE_1518_length_10043_cov_99.027951_2_plen_210_part_00
MPEALGADRIMRVPVEGAADDGEAMYVVYVPVHLKPGDHIDVDVPAASAKARVVNEQQLVTMAQELARNGDDDSNSEVAYAAARHGDVACDPFRTHVILPVLLKPSCHCDRTGYKTTELRVNRLLKKRAGVLKKRLLRIVHLEATIVAIPAAGCPDWDEIGEGEPTCCGRCATSLRVRMPPLTQESFKAATRSTTGFVAGGERTRFALD